MIVRASPWDRQAEVRTKISDAEYTQLEALAERHRCSVYEMAREMLRAALALASQREPNGAAGTAGDPLGTADPQGERLGATRTRAPGKARKSGAKIKEPERPPCCLECSTKVDPENRRCNVDGHIFEETLGKLTTRRDDACPLDAGDARSSGAADQERAGDARSTPGRPTP